MWGRCTGDVGEMYARCRGGGEAGPQLGRLLSRARLVRLLLEEGRASRAELGTPARAGREGLRAPTAPLEEALELLRHDRLAPRLEAPKSIDG